MTKGLHLIILLLVSASALICGQSIDTRVSGFIENKGQWPAEVLYLQRSPNLDAWITTSGFVLDQYSQNGSHRKGHVVRMKWVNGNPQQHPQNDTPNSTVTYFNSKQHAGMLANSYSRLRFNDVFPGIAAVYYLDNTGRLRYDLDVKPGASVSGVATKFTGDDGLSVNDQEVILNTSMGGIVVTDLYAFVFGKRTMSTPVSFRATSNGVAIVAPDRGIDQPLTIDPVVYGTYVGGSGNDVITSVVYSSNGVYVGGSTTGISFPTEVGAYEKTLQGQVDGFVALLAKDLSKVINYTYFGGSATDNLVGIALDASGKVCVTGETESDDLPVSIGSVGQIYKAQVDAYIARFSADLTQLEIATYLGGNKDDRPKAIAVEAATGAIYVCGSTTSNAQFPIQLAHQNTYGGQEDCFLAKLSAGGGTFVFCTYYGKDGNEAFTGIALDPAGSPYVTGYTTSSTFETAPTPGRFSSGRVPYDRTYNGGKTDAFLIKFFPDGTLSKKDDGTYSTFFGGSGDDEGRGVYIDAQGRAILVGVTTSKGLPAAGTLFTEQIGGRDIFMCLFTDDGRGLTACTYFGGPGDDNVLGIMPEASLNGGIMWGTTSSTEFPTVGSGSISTKDGTNDGFLTVLNPYALKFSTLMGGGGNDTTVSASFDTNGDIFFAVRGTSDNLTTTGSSWNAAPVGGADGYVGKWAAGTLSLVSPAGAEVWCIGTNRTISWAAEGMLDADVYQIDLSTDNGSTWSSIAKDVKGLSYNWKPATTLSTGIRNVIRVYTSRGHIVSSLPFVMAASPKIITDPKPVSACEGGSVQLMVVAEGESASYQWRKNGTPIGGANEAQYDIMSVTGNSAGSYDCVVSGPCAPAATSKAAKVSVAVKTAITQQPAGVKITEGEPFTLTCVATGTDLTYAWFVNGTAIDGATSNTYSIQNATVSNAGRYQCQVLGGCGKETSLEAVVEVGVNSVQEDVVAGGISMRVLGPIPAADFVMVRLSQQTAAQVGFRITSASGASSQTQGLGEVGAGTSELRIPLGSVQNGVYGLELVINGTVLRTAIIVVH